MLTKTKVGLFVYLKGSLQRFVKPFYDFIRISNCRVDPLFGGPVASMLSMKLVAKAAGDKRAVMADKADVERSTGYVLGGISPIGQKKRLETVVDQSAGLHSSIYVSAGRRGLEIELSPDDLIKLTGGALAAICQ